jgi:hypothetical protein
MVKPFDTSQLGPPLSVEETAKLYGVSRSEASQIEEFVAEYARRSPRRRAASNRSRAKAAATRKRR